MTEPEIIAAIFGPFALLCVGVVVWLWREARNAPYRDEDKW
jgi:hypothetical protein